MDGAEDQHAEQDKTSAKETLHFLTFLWNTDLK
jgi:hypothetical protein